MNFLKAVKNFLNPPRKVLPPSDLEGIAFLRRGQDGRLWRYTLDQENAKLWDECLRRGLRSSKGFAELDWRRDEVKA